MLHPIRDNLENIDWSLTDGDLASRHGTSRSVVRYWRRKLGQPSHAASPPIDQTGIDWSWGYKRLSAQLGISFWAARRLKRKHFGKSPKRKRNGARNLRDGQLRLVAMKAGCAVCTYKKPGVLCHFHHIVEASRGGPDTPDNLVYLCPNCHGEAHAGLLEPAFLQTKALLPTPPPVSVAEPPRIKAADLRALLTKTEADASASSSSKAQVPARQ